MPRHNTYHRPNLNSFCLRPFQILPLPMSSQDEHISINTETSRRGFSELYKFLRDAFQQKGLVRLLKSPPQRTSRANQSSLAFLRRSFNSLSNAPYRISNVLILPLSRHCSRELVQAIASASRPILLSTLCRFCSIYARILSRKGYYIRSWYYGDSILLSS